MAYMGNIESLKKRYIYVYVYGFPDGTVVKNPPANTGDARDADLILELGKSPGVRNSNPLHYSCPEKSHGNRSLAVYSPWGR